MARLVAVFALVAIALGIAGLAVNTERSSAIDIGDIRSRLDIQCHPNAVPSAENGWKGEVECSVRIDIPDRLSPPLPDTVKLTVIATYEDLNQNGRPNRGDRLQCAAVYLPNGNLLLQWPRGCLGS